MRTPGLSFRVFGLLLTCAIVAACGESAPPDAPQPSPPESVPVTATPDALAPASAPAVSSVYPKGTHARLAYTVTIEGDASYDGEVDDFERWSTRRTMTASMNLEADAPSPMAMIDPTAVAVTAVAPSSDMLALQEEAKACGGDVACQMRVAQKMMAQPEMEAAIEESEALEQMPMRYQIWRLPHGEKAQAHATLETHTDGLFITAGKERTTCSQAAEYDSDALAVGATVEVDTQTGIGSIAGALMLASGVMAEMHCDLDMSGHKRKESRSEYGPFFPTIDGVHRPFPGEPMPPGETIARGRIDVEGSYGPTPEFDRRARVELRWTLSAAP